MTLLCWLLIRVQLFVISWTVAHQAPLSMGFPRQECWSGLPFSSPGDHLNPGMRPMSLVLAGRFFTIWATREAPQSKICSQPLSAVFTQGVHLSHSPSFQRMRQEAISQRKNIILFSVLIAKNNFKGSLRLTSCFIFHLDMLNTSWKLDHWGLWIQRRKACLCNSGLILIPPTRWIPATFSLPIYNPFYT